MFKFYYFNLLYIKLMQIIIRKLHFEKSLILKLVNKSFKFVFFKVVLISIKSNAFVVNIPSYIDYGISFIMKHVLEDFFKAKFQFRIIKNSFDFFNTIRKWYNVKWCLTGRFTNFLDKVDLFLVGQFLFSYVKDIFILNLYFRFVSVGYWQKKTNFLFYHYFGKNNSFGSFLVEMYFFEFDKFIQNYIQNFHFLLFKVKFYSKYNTFFYVRFGFFWFLGVDGSFKVISFLKKKLIFFVFFNLRLSFKEFELQILSLITSSIFLWGVEIKSIVYAPSILLLCPIRAILFHFKNFGFLKWNKKILIPCAQRKWLSFKCSDIFWRYYLLKMRLFSMYFFVSNFKALLILKYFLKMSLIFTLGRKLKLTKKQISFKFKFSLVKWMR